MNRLQSELHRLYLASDADPAERRLAGRDGRVRALVLALDGPGGWDGLGRVWQGVQADLQLPAPAIAVSGREGYQLWFSLAEAVEPADGAAFLAALRARYLAGVPAERIAMLPAEAAAPPPLGEPPPVEVAAGRWSAFVAPDLAALFSEEPWLDLAPSAEAQADLLSRVASIRPAEWQRALEQLRSAEAAAAPAPRADLVPTPAAPAPQQDPARFLLAVMNDPGVDLPLRIEAAKALLPYFQR